ncbi:unnamed protein product [Moneuplotes crassus]|uniref:DNA polymerase n=1 Tax=Euplotes crassus TaxID=5936 RepID=A0AAD2D6M7_EUPCR|nr:unnamed protein product [Moneuplotes crassus]
MEETKENEERFNDYMAVRIVAHDHYMHTINNPSLYHFEKNPSRSGSKQPDRVGAKIKDQIMDIQRSEFMRRNIDRVPVTRILGSTKRGQRVCLNIHNYFPYFFTDYPIPLVEGKNESDFLYALAEIIERAFTKFTREKYPNSKIYEQQLIHSIDKVRGCQSIYGYNNEKNKEFLKITIYNPWKLQSLKELLWSGHILDYRFQSYEAHITHYMKLYTDCDLYGMDFVKFSDFKFRRGGLPKLKDKDHYKMTVYSSSFLDHLTEKPESFYKDYYFCDLDPDLKLFDYNYIKEHYSVTDEDIFSPYKKRSDCDLEVDVEYCLIKSGDLAQDTHQKLSESQSIGSSRVIKELSPSQVDSFDFEDEELESLEETKKKSEIYIREGDRLETQIKNLYKNRKKSSRDCRQFSTQKMAGGIIPRQSIEAIDPNDYNYNEIFGSHLGESSIRSSYFENCISSIKKSKRSIAKLSKSRGREKNTPKITEVDISDINLSAVKPATTKKKRMTVQTDASKACEIYKTNIKYVKSMLTLWKDEYARRKRFGITQPLPNIFDSVDQQTRTKIPHDQIKNERVLEMLRKNLRTYSKEEKGYERYQVDNPEGNPLEIQLLDHNEFDERYGNQYFRNLMKMREIWADKCKQGDNSEKIEFEDYVDTLDIIPSMKMQFKQMYKKKTAKEAKMELIAMDNTKITEFFDHPNSSNLKSRTKPPKEESKEPLEIDDDISCISNEIEEVNICLDDEKSQFDTNLTRKDKYKTPLTTSQKMPLSQKEETSPMSILKYKLKAPSGREVMNICKRLPTHEEDAQKLSGIFYSNENDLVLHYANKLIYDPKTKCTKKLPQSAMNSEWAQAYAFHQKGVKLQPNEKTYNDAGLKGKLEYKERTKPVTIREDLRLPDFALKRLTRKKFCIDDKSAREEVLKGYELPERSLKYHKISPSGNEIRSMLQQQKRIDREMRRTNATPRKRDQSPLGEGFDPKKISEETKIYAIRENRLLTRRGISPCTEIEMSVFKSNKNKMKSSSGKRKRRRPGNGELTLLDIHSHFETIHCLTTMMVEPIVLTLDGQKPNPEKDEFIGICVIIDDERAKLDLQEKYQMVKHIILIKDEHDRVHQGKGILVGMKDYVKLHLVNKEFFVFDKLHSLIEEYNPDIFMGYDINTMSIGYLNKKIRTDIKLSNMAKKSNKFFSAEEAYFDLRGQGRVSINVVDNMKINLHLKDYELDRVAFEVLQKREPNYSFDILKKAYLEGYPSRFKVFEYIFHQMELSYKFMDNLDLINRSITMAKTYGIDLQSVESRGTQYRVESMLSRIARVNKFLLLSPTQEQVWNQSLLEVIPLVMEPERAFHLDPVSVLDFQSLYPSIIISHNLCYTTCLGKIEVNENIQNASLSAFGNQTGRKKTLFTLTKNIKEFFGYQAEDTLSKDQEDEIIDSIIVSPNLTAFVKPHVRRGLLPQMLSEILNTRIMIKKSIKMYEKGSHDHRVLDSRQYALKMIANVTYGYTGAGFSGRMPCVEIADAIVSFARLSLEEAINFTESDECFTKILREKCKPTVIYGDTDSCFVKFPNLTIQEAYEASNLIVKEVTRCNPYPMELKYEKVYRPMFNLAKKRYCGFKYETPDSAPEVESKGIETIRRDFLPIVSKIMNKIIHILFIKNDMSLAKKYLESQWKKLDSGDLESVDLFLKEKLDKDESKAFGLPDTVKLAQTAKKQLEKVLDRVFHIFNTEVRVWMKDRTIIQRYPIGITGLSSFLSSNKFIIQGQGDKNNESTKYHQSVKALIMQRSFNKFRAKLEEQNSICKRCAGIFRDIEDFPDSDNTPKRSKGSDKDSVVIKLVSCDSLICRIAYDKTYNYRILQALNMGNE